MVHRLTRVIGSIGLVCVLAGALGRADAPFAVLAPGLEMATFTPDHRGAVRSPMSRDRTGVTILRIDPAQYEFCLLAQSNGDAPTNLSVAEWARRHHLVVALNAGMYNLDQRSHVGYMKVGDHINCRFPNPYQSAAAFGPRSDSLPPFRIYDLDEDSLRGLAASYTYVMQNLRLIKRPAENRWQPQDKRWRGLALGEDTQGRALVILTRSAWSMYDLNEFLLSLPIGIVAAQHLEGGSEAQLFVRTADTTFAIVGSYDTSLDDDDGQWAGWPVPNVIGIAPKTR
ncbi:MAG TPA: phosphodiester glycosidase family protein [candidate division Zixibacteria bacterium]|nr:phosphodiester glycosidase family protein [candidate division Zixibacteria bacterium]MDD4916483.1 phosphodiester glycosidase family protein [candidate division Zixibacteria bacterium]MDM7973785.1 phosphodiester glycosidase family protein [candidate division Zixibacteria bacterium]HOD65092.1 phosphodiester glycosidase family protein [candidate division Zixibacteria bacterium]HOZ06682.1 phosphodiester glycosidase family protein [candidate division Zixibacteria bacterium]